MPTKGTRSRAPVRAKSEDGIQAVQDDPAQYGSVTAASTVYSVFLAYSHGTYYFMIIAGILDMDHVISLCWFTVNST